MLKKARELWTGRSPWGGYITSDSDSIADVVNSHHYVNDSARASCLGVRDGGDDVDSGNTCTGRHAARFTRHPHPPTALLVMARACMTHPRTHDSSHRHGSCKRALHSPPARRAWGRTVWLTRPRSHAVALAPAQTTVRQLRHHYDVIFDIMMPASLTRASLITNASPPCARRVLCRARWP